MLQSKRSYHRYKVSKICAGRRHQLTLLQSLIPTHPSIVRHKHGSKTPRSSAIRSYREGIDLLYPTLLVTVPQALFPIFRAWSQCACSLHTPCRKHCASARGWTHCCCWYHPPCPPYPPRWPSQRCARCCSGCRGGSGKCR